MPTLYERLGGEKAVTAAVKMFYLKVLADERISEFFTDINMHKQIEKQKEFLTMVFGGPKKYTGRDMRLTHSKFIPRGLTDKHFDAVMENLAKTLKELGVNDGLIGEVAAIAESVRNDVLGR
ncbi:MAG: group 1 truncated hemoglobin [Bdellovibrionota bacterium]